MNSAINYVVLLLLVSAARCQKPISDGVEENVTVLHLLTLVPPGDVAGYLLPAAELAVDNITARDDLLPGYKLEIITAETETCDETLSTESF